jgi:hypothetical protein
MRAFAWFPIPPLSPRSSPDLFIRLILATPREPSTIDVGEGMEKSEFSEAREDLAAL